MPRAIRASFHNGNRPLLGQNKGYEATSLGGIRKNLDTLGEAVAAGELVAVLKKLKAEAFKKKSSQGNSKLTSPANRWGYFSPAPRILAKARQSASACSQVPIVPCAYQICPRTPCKSQHLLISNRRG
jgi:hypothetical protein